MGTEAVARISLPPMPPEAHAAARRRARPKRSVPHLRLVTPVPEAPSTRAPVEWVEIAIASGARPLHVVQLRNPRRFVIDDAVAPEVAGYAAPLRELGLEGGDLLLVRDGLLHVRVPRAARYAWFTLPGGRTHGKGDGERAGLIDRAADGALLFPLCRGRRCRFDLGPITIEIAAIEAPERRGIARGTIAWSVLAISLILNVIALAAILQR
jgi:hypothetical protein